MKSCVRVVLSFGPAPPSRFLHVPGSPQNVLVGSQTHIRLLQKAEPLPERVQLHVEDDIFLMVHVLMQYKLWPSSRAYVGTLGPKYTRHEYVDPYSEDHGT